jgi:hypothetical protein
MVAGNFEYCFECNEFPCERITHLDKRYRTKYGTTVIANLLSIQKSGINKFVRSENRKWTCSACGAMLCMHKPQCLSCGHVWLKAEDTRQLIHEARKVKK